MERITKIILALEVGITGSSWIEGFWRKSNEYRQRFYSSYYSNEYIKEARKTGFK